MLTKLSDYNCYCVHPRRVRNPYTHEVVISTCGRCVGCSKARANKYIGMINNMSDNSKDVLFVTLTYSMLHLPVARMSINGSLLSMHLTESSSRTMKRVVSDFDDVLPCSFSAVDSQLFEAGMPSTTVAPLGSGTFGILRKCEFQKFMKRFRKRFSYAFPTYHFKYYAIGEYGTRTFRPHYHIVLFFDNTVSVSTVKNLVSQSWKYGNYDVQRTKTGIDAEAEQYDAT